MSQGVVQSEEEELQERQPRQQWSQELAIAGLTFLTTLSV